ncbi:MAG: nuclear transport factor 2 family protein [Wenzhouxiangella sp.]|nr:nuclear transport factor 2 family protein [Wenzhouxiangella sp.]
MKNPADSQADKHVLHLTEVDGSHPVIDQWLEAVNTGCAERVCQLYAPDAILLPTLSPNILSAPDQILDYFRFFLDRQSLAVKLIDCYVQTYSEVKIDSGIYEFTWMANDKAQSTRARFTFVIRGGLIVEHHSSLSPDLLVG